MIKFIIKTEPYVTDISMRLMQRQRQELFDLVSNEDKRTKQLANKIARNSNRLKRDVKLGNWLGLQRLNTFHQKKNAFFVSNSIKKYF